ncbi:MAG: 2,3-bisphosphoglycerate-independent phosphoglycerate mutase [Candidatus Nomurabacteria bacterium]|jgi:2,3-bisphosphoglycerate-independent phosphoglycerate mutase|nr:2,3-bisphosphoglycerate-independent phosphoglycerate mutase [Candidatus Nomurabacteria bacterium]
MGSNKQSLKHTRPLVLAILDGVGLSEKRAGNAVKQAKMPNFERLMRDYPHLSLAASGLAVGVPAGDMGNSEVGHNTIGSGQAVAQGPLRVSEALNSGAVFKGPVWRDLIKNVKKSGGQLHFLGLLSDGNVHSHIDHLLKMIDRAEKEGIAKVRVHILLDGRDVPATSALEYVDKLEKYLKRANKNGLDYQIASGGGRMNITMDRYGADWSMVERGWQTHVLGEGRQFASARQAIETFRAEDPAVIDQYLPAFVVARDGQAIGSITDGDSVILFNFRADRAMEMAEALEAPPAEFKHFERGRQPKIYLAGMVEYDPDRHLPRHFLVPPVKISNTLSEFLSSHGRRQFALSESVKFGHITFYFNGNRSDKFGGEEYLEITSDKIPFDQQPAMQSEAITDVLVKKIAGEQFDFLRVNYPNGDMVGHFGEIKPTIQAMEAVDAALGRLMRAVDDAGGVLLVTADHGNAEEELYDDGRPKTSHTTNPVPFVIYDNRPEAEKYGLAKVEDPGLANIAATVAVLLNLAPPKTWQPPLVQLK